MKGFLQAHWKLVLASNLILGIALWFGFFTDVSLRGTILDILFPPFVMTFAMATIGVIPAEKKKLGRFAYIPSYGGGCLYLLMGLIMLIPPFTLGFLFGASEIASEVRIQQVASPNNIDFAEVHFRPVGAYTGGSGRIYIRIVNKYTPFIERDIYAGKTHTANEQTTNYVQWLDNNTLYITEVDEQINIDGMKSETPSILIVPIMIVEFINQQVDDSKLIAPLKDIPIYPGRILEDTSEVIYKTANRSFYFEDVKLKDALEWYKDVLSEYPWRIVEIEEIPDINSGQASKNYCIVAERVEENQNRLFYWEFYDNWSRLDINTYGSYIKIVVNTPNPSSLGVCSQMK